MGVRKPMALHNGHHTKEELDLMQRENDAATCGRSCLTGRPPKELIDKDARDEWKRITAILADMDIIGDLDRYALISYANSWSLYKKATLELSQQPLLIETEKGSVKNPLVNIQNTFFDQMRAAAAKAGLSVDTRLKHSALAVQNEPQSELTARFGDF